MYRNKTWIRRNQKSVARFLAMCLLEPSITMPDHLVKKIKVTPITKKHDQKIHGNWTCLYLLATLT